jgi:hypothetical protein
MERRKADGKQVIGSVPTASGEGAKKPYRAPELVEWGSIGDLTKGGEGKFPDGGGAWLS